MNWEEIRHAEKWGASHMLEVYNRQLRKELDGWHDQAVRLRDARDSLEKKLAEVQADCDSARASRNEAIECSELARAEARQARAERDEAIEARDRWYERAVGFERGLGPALTELTGALAELAEVKVERERAKAELALFVAERERSAVPCSANLRTKFERLRDAARAVVALDRRTNAGRFVVIPVPQFYALKDALEPS